MFLEKITWLSLVNYGKKQSHMSPLPCPSCQKVGLELDEDSVRYLELRRQYDVSHIRKPSANAGALEPLFKIAESFAEITAVRFQFSAFFRCSHCGDPVNVLGKAKSHEKNREFPLLRFVYFSPALNLFELKKVYPEKVKSEMEKSFAAFFSDPTAAGSRVRTSIEFLLDEQGVQKFRLGKDGAVQINKDGGQIKLPLGDRLKLFSESDPELGTILGAVKALGNEATHGADLQNEDLLDAYDLVEHVLEDLYVKRPQRSKLLARSGEMKQKFS